MAVRYCFCLLAVVVAVMSLAGCSRSATVHKAPVARSEDGEPVVTVSATLGPIDGDDYPALSLGHRARPGELRQITAFVKHYYTLAATENGAAACSLAYPTSVHSLLEEQSHSDGGRRDTCATAMKALFRSRHSQLIAARRSLRLADVRVNGAEALVLMHVSTAVDLREFVLSHANGGWQAYSLLDEQLR